MVLTPDGDGGFRASGGKYYIGNGNVAGHGLGVRPPRRRRGPGRLRLLRRRQRSTRPTSWSRTSSTRRCYVSEFELEDYPVRAGGRPAHRRATRSTPRSTRSTSASSTSASPRSASASTLLRGDHPRRRAASSTASASPSSRTCAGSSPTPTRACVAMKLFGDRAIDYFRSAEPRRPPLPALQPDHQDEGDDRGRAGRSTCSGT